MSIGAVGSGGGMAAYAAAPSRAPSRDLTAATQSLASAGTSLLKTALDGQAEMIMKLLTVSLQNQAAGQKMEVAGQIIDAYA